MARERLYQCNICAHKWWEPVDDSHDVFCPNQQCGTYHSYGQKSRVSNSHLGNASKAAEITSRMLERDYGIPPSMQVDNARAGDSYVKTPSAKPQAQYLSNGGGSNEIVQNFLSTASASGGLGPNGNLTGLDVISAAKKGGAIADPRKNGTFYGTKDK